MQTDEQSRQTRIAELLSRAGIPHEEIKVFGSVRCNVHVRCIGLESAAKWAALFRAVFPAGRINTVESVWPAKKNRGTVLRPTVRSGYLVGVIA